MTLEERPFFFENMHRCEFYTISRRIDLFSGKLNAFDCGISDAEEDGIIYEMKHNVGFKLSF